MDLQTGDGRIMSWGWGVGGKGANKQYEKNTMDWIAELVLF